MRQSYQLRMGRYEIGGFTREDNVSHLRKLGKKAHSPPVWRVYWKFWDCSFKMKPEPRSVPLSPINSEALVKLVRALLTMPLITVSPLEWKTPVQLWGGQLASSQKSLKLANKIFQKLLQPSFQIKSQGDLQKRRNCLGLNYSEVHLHFFIHFFIPFYPHSLLPPSFLHNRHSNKSKCTFFLYVVLQNVYCCVCV